MRIGEIEKIGDRKEQPVRPQRKPQTAPQKAPAKRPEKAPA